MRPALARQIDRALCLIAAATVMTSGAVAGVAIARADIQPTYAIEEVQR